MTRPDLPAMWAAWLTAEALPCVTGHPCDGSEPCRPMCVPDRATSPRPAHPGSAGVGAPPEEEQMCCTD